MSIALDAARTARHGTWIEINLERLGRNLKTLQALAPSGTGTLAVIKANAYGHGLAGVARAMERDVACFGISSLQEAHELKAFGISTPLFLFGRLFDAELEAAAQMDITLSISSFEEAAEISALAARFQRTIRAHIKVDTGMGRMGIPYRHALLQIQKIYSLHGIDFEGLYTHFPAAENEAFTQNQFYDFTLLLRALEEKGITFRIRHAANSLASTYLQSPVLNRNRPGLMLYGIYPETFLRERLEVLPVLGLKSRVILTKRLRPGESVGYGRTFTADKPTTIATLPVGYGHGYPVHLSGKAFILCRGERFPLAGRVSMDYVCVDFGDSPVRAGDVVTLIGEDGENSIRAEDLAALAGTIPYEIVTRLSARIPRIYA